LPYTKLFFPNCTGDLPHIITPEFHDMKGRTEEGRGKGLCYTATYYTSAYTSPGVTGDPVDTMKYK